VIARWYCTLGAVFDLADRRWHEVAVPEQPPYGPPVAAGGVVLFASAAYSDSRSAFLAYRPQPRATPGLTRADNVLSVNSSFELGRIAGIRIGVNWSWLVVFALIVWSLASAVFPDQNEGLSDATYVAMAIVAALLFFASILLHELGHAIQARRDGMEIEGITLWLFGGVAQFRGMFPSAWAEFRIAVAGPLVSLVLGVFFLAVAIATKTTEEVDGVAAWLGYINLMLLVFNLLPALPLDGGRVLRSVLWAARDSFTWATRVAGNIGRGFGFLFIAGGIALFVFANSFSGAWLAFLGWFLLGAASAEVRYLAVRDALAGLRVRDLMVREPATVSQSLSLGQFMDHIVWPNRYTTYPVTDNGRAVGLLPFKCVAEVPRAEWDARTVRDCMLPRDQVPVLDENDELVDVVNELGEAPGRGLVLDGERLVGLLSISDVARALETNGRTRRR
jgi:Zn-dependent protease/predicted transcriptional regulator